MTDQVSKADIQLLKELAEHRVVDLGMGGCETFVHGSQMVMSRSLLVQLCNIAIDALDNQEREDARNAAGSLRSGR